MNHNHSAEISRRQLLSAAGFGAGALCLAPSALFALDADTAGLAGLVERRRTDAPNAKVAVTTLRGGISVLSGAGGNITVLTGADGKLVVDSGIAGTHPKIAEALSGIDSQPVRHVVNTHWHFDHTDGNEWLHSEGATITAHQNTYKHLSARTRVAEWNFTFLPSSQGALPTDIVKKEKTLKFDGETIALRWFGPSHTDSDLSVHFTNADVYLTGDIWWNGLYPFIDYSTGGSINGTIQAVERSLATVTDKTIIISGHGPAGNKTQLTTYHSMLVAIRDKVAELKKQGLSLEEVIAAKPTASFDEKVNTATIKPDFFVKLVYQGV